MPWILLAIATVVEVWGTTCLKLSAGFTRPGYGVFALVLYTIGFYTFSLVLTKLNLSIAYSIMSGSVAILVVMVGIFFFKEPLTLSKSISFLLIISGIIGLGAA